MKAHVSIHVTCNDPDNGMFDRVARGVSYGECEIEPDNWDGYAFTEGKDFIRLHRRKYRIVSSKEWVGNWCWNAYTLERAEAKRFLNDIRNSGRWSCTCAPCRWYDWFNRGAADA